MRGLSTNDSAGKFRIRRVGSTVFGYFWTGSSWCQLGASYNFSDDVYIEIITCNDKPSWPRIQATHSNLRVNNPPSTPSWISYPNWLDQGPNSGDTQKVYMAWSSPPNTIGYNWECKASDGFGIGCWDYGSTSATIDSLNDSASYYFRIQAFGLGGTSNWSSWYGPVAIGDRTPPANPGAPSLIWHDQGTNSEDAQRVSVSQGLTSGATKVEFDNIAGMPEHDRSASSSTSYTTQSDVHDNQIYSYRSRMWDNSSNYSNWSPVSSITIEDRTPPVIASITGNTTGTTGELKTITANLNDNVGVTSAILYYTPIDGSEISLDFISGSISIPLEANKVGNITYYVTAHDTAGNHSSSPSTGCYTIAVIDDDAPIANANGPYIIDEGSLLIFDGSASSDNIGVVRYDWDYGDGIVEENSGPTPAHIYLDNGIYNVSLCVYDTNGNINNTHSTVTVLNVPPTVVVNQTLNEGGIVSFSGSFTDPGADTHKR